MVIYVASPPSSAAAVSLVTKPSRSSLPQLSGTFYRSPAPGEPPIVKELSKLPLLTSQLFIVKSVKMCVLWCRAIRYTSSVSLGIVLLCYIQQDDSGATMVVLKVDLYYEGCAKKVQRSIKHFV
ncbi:hypothetical protein Dimus_015653, partial [Dionaea muscipula]